jgi:hypothetical protein
MSPVLAEENATPATTRFKVGRDVPYGSGLKYKKCYGRPGNNRDGQAGSPPRTLLDQEWKKGKPHDRYRDQRTAGSRCCHD